MPLFSRLLALFGLGKKPVPRRVVCANVPSPTGIVDAAIARIKPPMVRTTLYVDLWRDDAPWRAKCSAEIRHYEALGCRVLVCVSGGGLKATLDEAIPIVVETVGQLLAAHPMVVVQVMNEADGDNPFNGDPDVAPLGWFLGKERRGDEIAQQMNRGARYGRMFSAVRSAHPSATIVTTGITGTPWAFLLGMAETSQWKPAVVCVHVYSSPLGPECRKRVDGVAGMPVWVTEAGWPRTDGGEARQELELKSILDEFNRDPRVEHLFVFTLNPDAGEPFRLVRPDGSFTPAGALLPSPR